MPGCFVECSVKDLFFCVALTAVELHILVIPIGVICDWNVTGKLWEYNVDGLFFKKEKNPIWYVIYLRVLFVFLFWFRCVFVTVWHFTFVLYQRKWVVDWRLHWKFLKIRKISGFTYLFFIVICAIITVTGTAALIIVTGTSPIVTVTRIATIVTVFFNLGVFLSLSDILRLFCIKVSEW
jgi:hypothetical protein